MTRKTLTPAQIQIARNKKTEAPFSGPWLDEKRPGTYLCAACGAPLFNGAHKYDSGSGWPSFFDVPDAGALIASIDHDLGMPRTEISCANCGAHMGHVFDDGPAPTGMRYCVNGSVLDFIPDDDGA